MDFTREIESHIAAGYSLLFVRTFEELRARITLRDTCRKLNKRFYIWSVTVGLCEVQENDQMEKVKDTEPPQGLMNHLFNEFGVDEDEDQMSVVVLCDFHPYLKDPRISRMVRELGTRFKEKGYNLVLLSPLFQIPDELKKDVTLLEFKLPGKEELGQIVDDIGEDNEVEVDEDSKERVVESLSGLTTIEAENALALSVYNHETFNAKAILDTKAATIRKSGVLEFYDSSFTMNDVGGFPKLKEWLELRSLAWTKGAIEYGIDFPRGIMLLGLPGCGKSLVAKAISNMWGFPLLMLDMGKVFGSLVGQSEENMREALELAEAIAPCILFIDEIEKGLAGTGGSGKHDSGVGSRVLGTLLTKMQERVKSSSVFYVATANDISALPAPLLRKGRFDELFFVDLPNRRERKEIFEIHLGKRSRNPKDFDLDTLVNKTDNFTGSEIEEVVRSGLFYSFSDGKRKLKTADLITAIEVTVPLSKTMTVELEGLRNWAKDRAVNVSGDKTERKLMKKKIVRKIKKQDHGLN